MVVEDAGGWHVARAVAAAALATAVDPVGLAGLAATASSEGSAALVRVTPTKHRYLLHLVLLHAQNTAIYRTWCL